MTSLKRLHHLLRPARHRNRRSFFEGSVEISRRAIAIRRFDSAKYERLVQSTILSQLPSLLDRDKDAIDVGGNVGHITRFLSSHCRKVYAYEPVSIVCDRLREACKDLQNVEIHQLALSDFCGEAPFFVDHERLSNSGLHDVSPVPTPFKPETSFSTTSVGVATIDSLRVESPGFIKIDVEGTELDVLRGAQRTLEQNHPALLVEVYEPFSKHPIEDLFRFVFELGYEAFYYDSGARSDRLVPVPSIESGLQAVRTLHEKHDGDFLFTCRRT